MPPDTDLRELLVRDIERNLLGHSEAVFNRPDRTHRYLLIRDWGTGPAAVFLMLNPSTADAMQDDPTVRRCTRFARREQCGALAVVNLFAFRATDPRELTRYPDPGFGGEAVIGARNDEFIIGTCQRADLVIAAWGSHGLLWGRGAAVTEMLADRGVALSCLGTTAAGQPRHPLMVRAAAPLIRYVPR